MTNPILERSLETLQKASSLMDIMPAMITDAGATIDRDDYMMLQKIIQRSLIIACKADILGRPTKSNRVPEDLTLLGVGDKFRSLLNDTMPEYKMRLLALEILLQWPNHVKQLEAEGKLDQLTND